MPHFFKLLLFFIFTILTGCAGIQSGKNELRVGLMEHKNGNLTGAFSVLSSLASSESITNSDSKDFARNYLLANPEIGLAGLDSLNELRLWEMSLSVSDVTARQIMLNDLMAFSAVYKDEKYQPLIKEKSEWLRKRYHFMSTEKYSYLTESSRSNFRNQYNLKVVDARKIGKIQGVDVLDNANKGFDKGDELGASLGSIIYLDRQKNFATYSPNSHFASIVTGSLLAASILNKPDEKYRTVKYGIHRLDGEFVYIHVISYSNFSHTAGACIFLENLMLINADACNK
jgi:hypothetical protein